MSKSLVDTSTSTIVAAHRNSLSRLPPEDSQSLTNFPGCIWQKNGPTSLAAARLHNRQDSRGATARDAALNTAPGGVTALNVETQALVSHGQYLYRAVKGGVVYQAKLW